MSRRAKATPKVGDWCSRVEKDTKRVEYLVVDVEPDGTLLLERASGAQIKRHRSVVDLDTSPRCTSSVKCDGKRYRCIWTQGHPGDGANAFSFHLWRHPKHSVQWKDGDETVAPPRDEEPENAGGGGSPDSWTGPLHDGGP